jgi:predicted metalloprotease with PDZ domain
MGLIAHEFFHVWNVKRMRPAGLWDFDYERENYTELLWVAEGFTAYYDDHLCRRAQILTAEEYLGIVANGITELRRTPGRMHQSLSEASFDAWIRLYRPDEHTRNSTLSYYGNGALAAMVLDLRIRAETRGAKSLDDAMRHLYEQTFANGRGYTKESVCESLSHAAGCDLSDLVTCLVDQPLDPDFTEIFTAFGLELTEKVSQVPYLGLHFKAGTTTISSVIENSPADQGRLIPGDEILGLAGLRVTSPSWSKVYDHVAQTGKPLEVLLSRRGRIVRQSITPELRPHGKHRLVASKNASKQQVELREAWLFETPQS